MTSCKRVAILVLPGLLVALTSAVAQERQPTEEEIGSVEVYLTPAQAIEEIFESVVDVDTTVAVLTPEEMDSLHTLLGASMPSDTVVVFTPRAADGSRLGYAVIAEEIGKYRPITFMVGTTIELDVQNVEVLVYRESRGGEVRRARFLRQYRGKGAGSAIRTNRDILNVAGATMSVNAMNHGVKRVLVTLEILAARNSL